MAQPTATEDELEYLSLTEEDEEYLRLPLYESTGLEEEYICLPSHGSKEQQAEEEEEMDEEQQVLCEGSLYIIVQWICLPVVSCTHRGFCFSAFNLDKVGPDSIPAVTS